jgi:hypothetical protein
MSSDKQIEANKRNAQKSTGPRTPAGKARVAVNPLKHGLTARAVVLQDEDPEKFESFRTDLFADLEPVGALEGVLAERIVIVLWRLRRVPIFEALLHRRGWQELIMEKAAAESRGYERTITDIMLAEAETMEVAAADREAHDHAKKRLESARAALDEPPLNVARILDTYAGPLMNLWKREVALSRSFERTLHEFQRLRAARRGEQVAAPSVLDLNVNLSDDPAPVQKAEVRYSCGAGVGSGVVVGRGYVVEHAAPRSLPASN